MKNIAFVHMPRTAGTYVYSYLVPLLSKKSYKVRNSWVSGLQRDWNRKELLLFLEPYPSPQYVHNHSASWDADTFYKYKEKGWFMFSFARHPGDRFCSEYFYWVVHKNKFNLTLNEYVKERILNPIRGNIIPPYWRDFDYIKEFNDENFKEFLQEFFDFEYIAEEPKLKSSNKGYDYYCQKGEISEQTQELLKKSQQYKIYLEIKENRKEGKSDMVGYLLDNYPIITKMMLKNELSAVLKHLKIVLDDNIKGDIVEMGCNEGTTSLFIQRLLKECGSDKKFYVYDSFEGLPEKSDKDKSSHPLNSYFRKGVTGVPEERFIYNFKKANLELPIINKGWFKDIPSRKYPKKVAFAFFDGDFYSSIMDSFRKVYPRLSVGARVVIDDCGWQALPGVEKACQDFLKNKPEGSSILRESGEAFFIKKTGKILNFFGKR